MDTIQLDLIFEDGCDFTKKEEERIRKTLDRLESPYGHSYCDVLRNGVIYGNETKVIVKLSFPRFYFENNAYLISTYSECREVQKHFVEQLQKNKFLKKVKAIKITRVDIPFTYLMKEDKEFHNYSNVFKILASAFTKRYSRVEGKSVVDTKKKKEQTVTFTDAPVASAYNTKIMIYNQKLNLDSKLKEEIDLRKTLEKFPDLPRRMRIEMSKRINRKEMSLKDFQKFELFEEYSNKYKKELKNLLFDEELLDGVYEEEVEKLAEILEEERKFQKKRFTYKNFLSEYVEDIYDYRILRGAVKSIIFNESTKESAITEIRKELKSSEERKGLIVIGVRDIVEDIADTIKKSFKGQRKKKVKEDEWGKCPF